MTFYFYDLETSGIDPRAQRIMQFAGQRTDESFNPIGEPQNWIIKLTDEILPDPDAILITGITPQKTLEEGYSEAEFLKLFHEVVLQPDTVILGFNTIRFDDEFMRATLWRNFYDAYEWQWQDGRSRWDLLDVVRMIRALRPEGIEWPIDKSGQQTNRLELISKLNNLQHENAHDALSDVFATIEVAKMLKAKQPKIFDYLFSMHEKKKLQSFLEQENAQPFLYCSGRYSSNWQKTSAVIPVYSTEQGGVLVYDLRQDPLELAKLDDETLKAKLFLKNENTDVLPVKNLKLNCCPAIAPLGVLDKASQERLSISVEVIQQHFNHFRAIPGFAERIGILFEQNQEVKKASYAKENDPDFQLYDNFVSAPDKVKLRAVRAADKTQLADLQLDFSDSRLEKLLPRYKARNFPSVLSETEREQWEMYRSKRVMNGLRGQLSIKDFLNRVSILSEQYADDDNKQYLLQELQLYAESIIPFEV